MYLTITPEQPFDFDLSANIFSEGDMQIRKYNNGKFWQVIRVNNKLVLITITSSGNVDKPKLSIELKSSQEITDKERINAEELIISIFNLKFDLERFYDSLKDDKIMSALTKKLKGLKSPTTPTVFESLIDSIIEQQISLKAAHSMQVNIIKTCGSILKLDNKAYYAFPAPHELASAPPGQLRGCGLSAKKADYIKNISKLIVDDKLDLEKFKNYEDINEIIEELDKIKGIGVWTAELTMIRGMHKLEAIPADDMGIRRCISHYYCSDRKITGEEARLIAEKWGKWKGLAAYYLIVGERLGITI
jgi:DNA-3-methyladenine glycosylase II